MRSAPSYAIEKRFTWAARGVTMRQSVLGARRDVGCGQDSPGDRLPPIRCLVSGIASMAPRAYWKGYLRLSLVSCPAQLFPAISEREKIRFHQINRKTGNRIKYCKLDAMTGKPVRDEDIIKGYEVGKDRYVEITDDELE